MILVKEVKQSSVKLQTGLLKHSVKMASVYFASIVWPLHTNYLQSFNLLAVREKSNKCMYLSFPSISQCNIAKLLQVSERWEMKLNDAVWSILWELWSRYRYLWKQGNLVNKVHLSIIFNFSPYSVHIYI